MKLYGGSEIKIRTRDIDYTGLTELYPVWVHNDRLEIFSKHHVRNIYTVPVSLQFGLNGESTLSQATKYTMSIQKEHTYILTITIYHDLYPRRYIAYNIKTL
jgi:hypothetical protein